MSKSRKLAESYADKAMARMPAIGKAYGARETLVSAFLPTAKIAVRQQKIAKRTEKMAEKMAAQNERMSAVIERDRLALEMLERHAADATKSPAAKSIWAAEHALLTNYNATAKGLCGTESS